MGCKKKFAFEYSGKEASFCPQILKVVPPKSKVFFFFRKRKRKVKNSFSQKIRIVLDSHSKSLFLNHNHSRKREEKRRRSSFVSNLAQLEPVPFLENSHVFEHSNTVPWDQTDLVVPQAGNNIL
jgi:hypothetical protein